VYVCVCGGGWVGVGGGGGGGEKGSANVRSRFLRVMNRFLSRGT